MPIHSGVTRVDRGPAIEFNTQQPPTKSFLRVLGSGSSRSIADVGGRYFMAGYKKNNELNGQSFVLDTLMHWLILSNQPVWVLQVSYVITWSLSLWLDHRCCFWPDVARFTENVLWQALQRYLGDPWFGFAKSLAKLLSFADANLVIVAFNIRATRFRSKWWR